MVRDNSGPPPSAATNDRRSTRNPVPGARSSVQTPSAPALTALTASRSIRRRRHDQHLHWRGRTPLRRHAQLCIRRAFERKDNGSVPHTRHRPSPIVHRTWILVGPTAPPASALHQCWRERPGPWPKAMSSEAHDSMQTCAGQRANWPCRPRWIAVRRSVHRRIARAEFVVCAHQLGRSRRAVPRAAAPRARAASPRPGAHNDLGEPALIALATCSQARQLRRLCSPATPPPPPRAGPSPPPATPTSSRTLDDDDDADDDEDDA